METSTKIQFSNDDGYQFETALDDSKTAIQVHVSHNNSTLFQSTVSIATPTNRNSKFIFSGQTSTIYNDTGEALYCSLADAGSYADAKTMALGGLGVFYAFLGLAAAIPGMPPQVGFPIAAQGMILAIGGLADGAIPNADETVRSLLLPGRRISRTAGRGMAPRGKENAVTLTRISIERKKLFSREENILSIKTAKYILKKGEEKLSTILRAISEWDPIITLFLDGRKRIESHALAILPNISIPAEEDQQEECRWGKNLCDSSSGTMLTWGSEPGAKAYMLKPRRNRPRLLVTENCASAFIERPIAPNLASESKVVSSEKDPQTLVWVLEKYAVADGSATHEGDSLGTAGDHTDVVNVIVGSEKKYAVYTWAGQGSRVLGYPLDAAPTLIPINSSEGNAYIIVCREEPFQRLVSTETD